MNIMKMIRTIVATIVALPMWIVTTVLAIVIYISSAVLAKITKASVYSVAFLLGKTASERRRDVTKTMESGEGMYKEIVSKFWRR